MHTNETTVVNELRDEILRLRKELRQAENELSRERVRLARMKCDLFDAGIAYRDGNEEEFVAAVKRAFNE